MLMYKTQSLMLVTTKMIRYWYTDAIWVDFSACEK